MRLGGPAQYVIEVTNRDELRQAYKNALRLNQPTYIIGGGSNLIAHDEGFNGVIIKNQIKGITTNTTDGSTLTVTAAAGESWDELVRFTVEQEYSGIEAMSGIPGSAGAAPIQNIGAYGQELSDTFVSLEAYDILDDRFITMNADDCQFSYRDSIFRGSSAGRYAVISITLQLFKNTMQPPFYQSLQAYFDAKKIESFSPAVVRDAVIAVRTSKLPDPNVLPSAGSFFKNAILEEWQATALKEKYPDMPSFAMGDGKVKVFSGWLIEQCDLKGQVIHGMKVHEGNAVVLINQSASTYSDLSAAREEIKSIVRDKFQINLDQEPLELLPVSAQ